MKCKTISFCIFLEDHSGRNDDKNINKCAVSKTMTQRNSWIRAFCLWTTSVDYKPLWIGSIIIGRYKDHEIYKYSLILFYLNCIVFTSKQQYFMRQASPFHMQNGVVSAKPQQRNIISRSRCITCGNCKLQIAQNNCDDLGIEHKKHYDLGTPQCRLFVTQHE